MEPFEPEIWAAGQELFGHFWLLDCTRQIGMAACPLLPSEIETWGRMTGLDLYQWECEAIFAMDRARLAGPKEALDSDPIPGTEITVGMFDALFGG